MSFKGTELALLPPPCLSVYIRRPVLFNCVIKGTVHKEERRLLTCETVQSGRNVRMFRRILLSLSSGQIFKIVADVRTFNHKCLFSENYIQLLK